CKPPNQHQGVDSACHSSKDGHVDVVANDAGDRVTPAVVAFCDGETLVGLAAKQGRIRNANNTVVGVKRILGHKLLECKTFLKVYLNCSRVTNSKTFDIGLFLVELFAIFQLCFWWTVCGFAMVYHRLCSGFNIAGNARFLSEWPVECRGLWGKSILCLVQ
uniref:Uncharacterized protein n=1 Tax=Eptatretus burgeri TaxID=7764 RepID=A0A8C4QS64_EPTBU